MRTSPSRDPSVPIQLDLENPIRRVERLLDAVRDHGRDEISSLSFGILNDPKKRVYSGRLTRITRCLSNDTKYALGFQAPRH